MFYFSKLENSYCAVTYFHQIIKDIGYDQVNDIFVYNIQSRDFGIHIFPTQLSFEWGCTRILAWPHSYNVRNLLLQVRGILNKLTPEKFQKLSDDLLQTELNSGVILKGVILLVSRDSCSHFSLWCLTFTGVSV